MGKSRVIFATMLLVGGNVAFADPGVFAGVVYNFGSTSSLGISLKVLSTNKEEHGAVAGGVSFYPLAKTDRFGVDLGAGYLFQNGAVTLGWDFMQSRPQVGVGYANTEDDKKNPPPAPSDRRLKKDIVYLTTLPTGIKLYSFKYFWGDENFVGVMAQDLLLDPTHRNAVKLMPGEFYVVDYKALGLKMITLREWSQSHENIFATLQQAYVGEHV